MDLILNNADHFLLTPYIYPSSLPEDNPLRQIISLFLVTNVGGFFLYFLAATLSYVFVFDKRLLKHPLILQDQIRREIIYTCKSIPLMSIPTICIFFFEVRGYSKLYDNVGDAKLGWFGILFSIVTFILFTDMCIYWIHRVLHHRSIYKYIHKPHHKWKVPTPYASHALHPVDGFVQSCPYHIYAFLFPLPKFIYLGLFVFVNFWTVSIHDGGCRVPDVFKPLINGSAHHIDHHLFDSFNYGQFFTLWDRIGKTFRHPSVYEGSGPMVDFLKRQ